MQRCTFEMDDGSSTMCSLEQDVDDKFDWTLRSGPTPSEQTGPSSAYSGNYYIYIEASKPRRAGDEARLVLRIYLFSYVDRLTLTAFNEYFLDLPDGFTPHYVTS